jgi:hypothetical protein
MDNIVSLTRFRKKCLETVYLLSQIDSLCQKMIEDVNQESLQELVSHNQNLNDCNVELQNLLVDYIKEITNETEEDEISSVETENGYKL